MDKVQEKVKEKVKEKRTHLTDVEMLKIENFNLRINLLEHQQALLEKEYRLYAVAADAKKIDIRTERTKAERERKEYNESIKNEFDLASETFGYDPLTGEVK